MDPIADNYRPKANTPAPCAIPGCTLADRVNYRAAATYNNGTCLPLACAVACAAAGDAAAFLCVDICEAHASKIAVLGCTNAAADNYRALAAIDDGTCLVPGCTDSTSAAYNSRAAFDDGSCLIAGRRAAEAAGEDDAGGGDADDGDRGDGRQGPHAIPTADGWAGGSPLGGRRRAQVAAIRQGCMSPSALNYDSAAVGHLPDTCRYAVHGCMDPADTYYTPDSTDNTLCTVHGCMGPDASNFDSLATRCAACRYDVRGCTNRFAINFPGDATVDDGSCVYGVVGCTSSEPLALNFNARAGIDDGSCIFEARPVPRALCAMHYAPYTMRHALCAMPRAPCPMPHAHAPHDACTDARVPCGLQIRGCTLSASLNFAPDANRDDGSCIPATLGCTSPDAFNYNPVPRLPCHAHVHAHAHVHVHPRPPLPSRIAPAAFASLLLPLAHLHMHM